MRPDFNYTDAWTFDSECVNKAWWDSETHSLFVVLHSGLERVYRAVDPKTWQEFKDADSAGAFWNYEFKQNRENKYQVMDGEEFNLIAPRQQPKVSATPDNSWKFAKDLDKGTPNNSYEVHYSFSGAGSTKVEAGSDQEALEMFTETGAIKFSDVNIKVESITRNLG